jgi:hypothetical protein
MKHNSQANSTKSTPNDAPVTKAKNSADELREEELTKASGGIIAVLRKAGGDPN